MKMEFKVIKNGDIFNSKADSIVNPVNCEGVMGAGLALKFKERYPKMFIHYKENCNLSIGRISFYPTKDYLIVLFPTKNKWKNKSKYLYIMEGLIDLKKHLSVSPMKSIAFPKIGCGLGGLKWYVVKELIIEILGDLDIVVELYE